MNYRSKRNFYSVHGSCCELTQGKGWIREGPRGKVIFR